MTGIQTISARSANLLMAKTGIVSVVAGSALGAGVARLGYGGSDHAREHLTRGTAATTGLVVGTGGAGILALGHGLAFPSRAEQRVIVDGAEQLSTRWYAIPRAHLGWGVLLGGISASIIGVGMSMNSIFGSMGPAPQ
jgi:hypothetical protein